MIAIHNRHWPGESQVDMEIKGLNSKVAVYVFGWRVRVYTKPDGSEVAILAPKNAPKWWYGQPKQYVSDQGLVWDVIGRMKTLGFSVSLNGPAKTTDNKWHVTFFGKQGQGFAADEQVQVAVCEAAVNAVRSAKEA